MSDLGYRHLLLAADFTPESDVVVGRATDIRERFGARLSLVHVVEQVPAVTDYAGGDLGAEVAFSGDMKLEQELLGLARKELDALGERLDVPPADRVVEFGPTGRSIERVAADLGVDLIVVGARDRNWLERLFGSTSKTLLRHEVCDLLAVRIVSGE